MSPAPSPAAAANWKAPSTSCCSASPSSRSSRSSASTRFWATSTAPASRSASASRTSSASSRATTTSRRPELLSNRRTRTIVKPRQIAMYLAKVMTPRSLPGDRPPLRRPRPHHGAARRAQDRGPVGRRQHAGAGTRTAAPADQRPGLTERADRPCDRPAARYPQKARGTALEPAARACLCRLFLSV